MKKQGIVKKWIKGLLPSKEDTIPVKSYEVQEYPQKEQEDWTEAEAEIINHIINMDSLMRITKQLDYYYEYITLEKINEVLCQEIIDLSQAKKALLGGLVIDDIVNQRKYVTKNLPYQYYSLRSLLWKIDLQYLKAEFKAKWITSLEKNLLEYTKMVEDYIVCPVEKKIGLKTVNNRKVSSQSAADGPKKDHPLNFSQQSKWKNYFKDRELWQQIEKDTKRTRKSCNFFSQPHTLDAQKIETDLNPNQITFLFQNKAQLTYADCLTRIIFLYLKKNQEEYYSQGMNEYAAMIFYCFTNKNSEYFRRVSESDAFCLFQRIMRMLPKKHFQKGGDYVKKLNAILLKMDLRLHEEIQKQGGIQTLELLTMRWFLTGFLNEFPIDECLQLWDVIVGWPDIETPLCDKYMYMALSMIHLHRERIMNGENLAAMLSKIEISAIELGEKTLSLFKIFPKLVGE